MSCSPAKMVRAQSMLQLPARAGYTLKCGHYVCEPCVSGSHLLAFWALHDESPLF